MTRDRRSWPWWRWVLTGLSALAMALSAYLSWHYLLGGSVIGCGGGSPCDQVLSSRWSAVGGVIPVTGLAAGVYLAMLLASLFIGPATAAPDRQLAWGALLILVGSAAGSAVWFTILQKWVIGVFCPYCMATHITGLLLAALVIWQAPRQFEDVSTAVALTNPAQVPDVGSAPPVAPNAPTGPEIAAPVEEVFLAFSRRAIRRLPLIGLALAGVLAACQVGFAPPAVYRSGESLESVPALDPHAVPLVGSPNAPFVVTLFFDYECPHCQQVHSMLEEAIRRYGGKLAFALFPAPLNTQCNPYVAHDLDQFKDSCELARVGLAVWLARPEAFSTFDSWLFSPEPGELWQPRGLDTATLKAVELVGQAKFDAAWGDPWIDEYMRTSIQLYGNTRQSGNAVPKLVFGSRWVTPEPHDADELVLILHDSLGVPRP